MPSSHLVVMIAQADADGTAGSGQDGRHGIEVDHHICYSLQDELFIHYGLTACMGKQKGHLKSSVAST